MRPAPAAGDQSGVADREGGQEFQRADPPRVGEIASAETEAPARTSGQAPPAAGPVRERPRSLSELAMTRLLALIPMTLRPWRSDAGLDAYRRTETARGKNPFRKGSLVDRKAA
jgi:hypothetical protein